MCNFKTVYIKINGKTKRFKACVNNWNGITSAISGEMLFYNTKSRMQFTGSSRLAPYLSNYKL